MAMALALALPLLKASGPFVSQELSPVSESVSLPVRRPSISRTPSALHRRPSGRNRPLPPAPATEPALGRPSPPKRFSVSTPKQSDRSRTLSSFMPSRRVQSSLVTLISHPRILQDICSFLYWPDYLALSQTCKGCRNTFKDGSLRDVVLSSYVDGYGYCLRRVDVMLKEGLREIPVTLFDLNLLMISQSTPLHIYPTHSLTTMSSLLPSVTEHSKTQRLAELTQAHSRFVLLIQALAHASYEPPPSEPEPESLSSPASFGDTSRKSRVSHSLSRFSSVASSHTTSTSVHSTGHRGPRELKFPAPLACAPPAETIPHDHGRVPVQQNTSNTPQILAKRASSAHHRPTPSHSSSSASSGTTHFSFSSGDPRSSNSSSSHSTMGTIKKKNRLSFFGGGNTPPPPPSEPKDLKFYSIGWRRSLANASNSYANGSSQTRRSSRFAAHVSEGWQSDDDSPFPGQEFGTFEPPSRRMFTNSSENGSSSSSFGSTSATSSTAPTSPFGGRSTADPSPSPSFTRSPLSRSSWSPLLASSTLFSPHDLSLATSRVRAPVLRVFVPCSILSESAHGVNAVGSIEQCEDQLIESGLWEHMSIGDVVCNLGFVPPNSGASNGGSEGEDEVYSVPQGRGRGGRPMQEMRSWLIFNGEILVPFCPSLDRLPVENPLTLPSPWYYEHIMPPETASSSTPSSGHPRYASYDTPLAFSSDHRMTRNPRMVLDNLPPPCNREVPQTLLVNYTSHVRSPHSTGGFASVQKWVWTARVFRAGGGGGLSAEMGIGWEGEWILEGEGTREGRQELLDILQGIQRGKREWEFVRGRSGGGKIWLRLLPLSTTHSALRSQSHPPILPDARSAYTAFKAKIQR